MKVALVSPYSWTYPGGVTRHIEALGAAARRRRPRGPRAGAVRRRIRAARRSSTAARGRRSATSPAGSRRWARPSAGRPTARCPTSRTRRTRSPRCGGSCAAGGFDVVHLHEPVAPVVGWDALTSVQAPLVGTFHCHSESLPPHLVASLLGRPSQAQPAVGADRGLRRPRPGRGGASTAGATGSSPTAWRCRREACRPRAAVRPASRCGSSSSARPSSARACRCCCAPSRRCARRRRPSSPWSGSPRTSWRRWSSTGRA